MGMNDIGELSRDSAPLYRQIAELWREKIISGEYGPGDELPSERDISESLHVSRIPVREAMKSLEYLGIVKQVRGKGVFVQKVEPSEILSKIGPFLVQPSLDTILQLFDLRILLEEYTAREAALRATPEDIARLEHTIRIVNDQDSTREAAEAASNDFHILISGISGNQVIQMVWLFLSEMLQVSRHATLWAKTRKVESTKFHERILDAIRSHDADEAGRVMREHLIEARRIIEEKAAPDAASS